MEISTTEQDSTDFDWFGVDEDGRVGHFTTAGFKRLPQSVASDADGLQTVTQYFLSEAPSLSDHKVDQHLQEFVDDWSGEQNESKYLSSFISMADRGLFSFDVPTYVKPGTAYFRVAVPTNPITLSDLPEQVRNILSRTQLKGIHLQADTQIPYASTLTF